MYWRRSAALAVVVAIVAALALPAAALGAVTIVENKGVGPARLGTRDSTAAKLLGGATRTGRDRSYENRVVYYFYFGRKMSSGKYPLEMYSNKSRSVFTFVVNSSAYKTAKGIGVGSTQAALLKAYGTALRKYPGPVYTRYALGGRTGTDFYVKAGAVKQVMVRTY